MTHIRAAEIKSLGLALAILLACALDSKAEPSLGIDGPPLDSLLSLVTDD